jgi:hypothetical protein
MKRLPLPPVLAPLLAVALLSAAMMAIAAYEMLLVDARADSVVAEAGTR